MISVSPEVLRPVLLRRENESHKGDYGHLLIVAGCERMPGAAVLATGAALHSGCGLVTLHSTRRALQAAVNAFPSAMLSEDPGDHISIVPEHLDKYSAIAIGPGLGQDPETKDVLLKILSYACGHSETAVVIDADALNILSGMPDWERHIPLNAVFTPHLGELRRFEALRPIPETSADSVARKLAGASGHGVTVLKGYHTRVFAADGKVYENTTGNPGMAKGGSGDVLTGLIGGLLARGYPTLSAALLGVWIHGRAGDCLTEERTAEGYDSRDLIDYLWKGFHELIYD
ncbi:MAG: NAD(P)H-hydrate dehydratase [Bacteroidales bacterium]|nr:NAD(P)H-hydrate dehydratase [Bacteroidales bacterium]